MGPIPFSTLLSANIVNALHYGKVKMPTVDLYDRTTDPQGQLGVYKAQMYIQYVNDAAYYQFFFPTLKGVVQS